MAWRSDSYGRRNPSVPPTTTAGRGDAMTNRPVACATAHLLSTGHLVTNTVIDLDRLTTQPGAGSELRTVQLEATQTDL